MAHFHTKRRACVPVALLLGGVLSACQSLIGLDAPHLADAGVDAGGMVDSGHDHDGAAADGGALDGASPEVVAECEDFCTTVDSVCNGKDAPPAYPKPEACRALCVVYDRSSTSESAGTFACRSARATQALAEKGGPPEEAAGLAELCAMASPGGDARSSLTGLADCGSSCENYCQMRATVCKTEETEGLTAEDCLPRCKALIDIGAVNAGADFGDFPDTIQCRLAHLSMAAYTATSTHCEHSRINPIRDVDPATGEPLGASCDLTNGVSRVDLCNNYCHLVTQVCSADDSERVWDSEEQCQRVCQNPNSLERGNVTDYGENTWACRRAHTYTALEEPQTKGTPKNHCGHASLGGGGHCGESCAVYCELAERNCKADFDTTYPAGGVTQQERCQISCVEFGGVGGSGKFTEYSLEGGKKAGNTYNCRLHALINVLDGHPDQCPAVLGGSPCRVGN
jgi:hypothetical protein